MWLPVGQPDYNCSSPWFIVFRIHKLMLSVMSLILSVVEFNWGVVLVRSPVMSSVSSVMSLILTGVVNVVGEWCKLEDRSSFTLRYGYPGNKHTAPWTHSLRFMVVVEVKTFKNHWL